MYVRCKSANEVAKAIKTMVIRGAPAIGVAAAMGIALGMERSKATGTRQFAAEFQKTCDLMASTRPTAVNLFWAIERMKRCFSEGALAGESVDQLKTRLRREATAIHDEDVASCRAIGAHGATLVPSTARILTHCNAGALATAGYGTALGVIRGAIEAGKRVRVLADETRPFLQGSRLTAWELMKDGIDTTVITDSMAGALMRDDADRSRGGRRRPHCRQRRYGQQDRHLHRRGARQGARHSVLCRGAVVDDRSLDGRRVADPDRGAPRERSHARRIEPARARRRAASATPRSTSRRTATSPPSSPTAAFSIRRSSRRSQTVGADAPRLDVLILGIETSCDETAAAVVEAGAARRPALAHCARASWPRRSRSTASGAASCPELASRQHVRDICGVVERALARRASTGRTSTPSPSRRARA